MKGQKLSVLTNTNRNNDAFSRYLIDSPFKREEESPNLAIDEKRISSTLRDSTLTSNINKDNKKEAKLSSYIFRIEDAEPPMVFEGNCEPLPSIVEYNRIVNNIINAQRLSDDIEGKKKGKNEERESEIMTVEKKVKIREEKLEKWKKFLEVKENEWIFCDAFWFSISKFFFRKKREKDASPDREENKEDDEEFLKIKKFIEESLLNRMAKNYVNFTLSIDDKFDKDEFLKEYFNILAQAVFYSFFYAFPKSRVKFNDDLKKLLLNEFSYQFTGVVISKSDVYMEKWNLDLGAGNMLKNENLMKKQKENSGGLPYIDAKILSTRNKRAIAVMKYSPIIERYLQNNKYKTRNYLRGFKMKFTEYDKNQKILKERFEKHTKTVKTIMKKISDMKEEEKKEKQNFEEEIKKFKSETLKHQRRLEKRKAEELERGAHEYANYLVSMLNSGITVATLGVGAQKRI